MPLLDARLARKVGLALMVTLAVTLAFAAAGWAQQSAPLPQPPSLPHMFYGSATVKDQPAPIGAQVEARGTGVITGIPGNPVAVTVAGRYGGPGARDMLVQGNVEDGTPIEFFIDGMKAEWAVPGGQPQGSYPYQAGMVTELNLKVQVFRVYLPLTLRLGPPPPPHAFYGSATVNGQPAPVGAMVEARGGGVKTGIPGNPVAVPVAGLYGWSAQDCHPLMVQGEAEDGTPIEFFIDGVKAECAVPGGPWQGSYPYQAGMFTELNLRVGASPVLPVDLPLITIADVILTRFEAVCQDDGTILVVWETSSEFQSTAYFLYRAESPDGPWEDYIDFEPATGFEDIPAVYSFTDDEVSRNVTYYYRLEEIADDNSSTFFGPIMAWCPSEACMFLPFSSPLRQR